MRSAFYHWPNQQNKTTPLEVARFGLLSCAVLPFSLWVAIFSYDYLYRFDLCQDALTHQDDEIKRLLKNDTSSGQKACFGREKELQEMKILLNKDPDQVILVAGANESGKSRFVSEMLRDLNTSRGITYIHLSQLGVDSVSTLAHAIVDAFNLQWLSMRYALVDVLPFAGSEIVVMKERFSERDLTQALRVITQALKRNAASSTKYNRLPIIVVDGIGEGESGWINSPEGERCLQTMLSWCIYVTKERQLAHIIYTGNEKFVHNIMDQNRLTRGHIKIVGLGDLSRQEASKLVLQELPDATDDEIEKIINTFGGFIHDIKAVSRDIHDILSQEKNEKKRSETFDRVVSSRFRQQVERVRAAFAKGRNEDDVLEDDTPTSDKDEEMDPYMDPLKAVYSEAQASKRDAACYSDTRSDSSYSKLQLWQTIKRLVSSEKMTAPFAELRDAIFDGDVNPLLELMQDDVFGFEINNSSFGGGLSWQGKPATPALGRAFRFLVSNGVLKEEFGTLEIDMEYKREIEDLERERLLLWRKRRSLEQRKSSLKGTVELGKSLGRNKIAQNSLASAYESIVAEEAAYELHEQELRNRLDTLVKRRAEIADSTKQDIPGFKRLSHHQSYHVCVERKLKSAIMQIISREEPGVENLRELLGTKSLENAFRYLDRSGDGTVVAEDLVRVIENITGEKVRLEDAQSLVRAWDIN
eukprot:CAMPEP_0194258352 /NCGR_PEP_ID=MMETSP0158-20130606/41129_1 /TAXON_ID=33649 /ORGANISM="Thalassionema nitzschioides, Strain L26-B" /LENGTH=698 /DNA_ID=CAMNT_0038997743 /DNA_START=121 /DNA_END=2214 /DNA_ORIENTATION=-